MDNRLKRDLVKFFKKMNKNNLALLKDDKSLIKDLEEMGDVEDEVLIQEGLKQCDFILKYFSGEEEPRDRPVKDDKSSKLKQKEEKEKREREEREREEREREREERERKEKEKRLKEEKERKKREEKEKKEREEREREEREERERERKEK